MPAYDNPGVGITPAGSAAKVTRPANEVGDPNDGMGAAAQALVQFIHLHAVWGNGPRSPNSARTGSTPGASSMAESRGDGIDWAYVINTRDWPPNTSPTLNDLGTTIDNLLNTTPLP